MNIWGKQKGFGDDSFSLYGIRFCFTFTTSYLLRSDGIWSRLALTLNFIHLLHMDWTLIWRSANEKILIWLGFVLLWLRNGYQVTLEKRELICFNMHDPFALSSNINLDVYKNPLYWAPQIKMIISFLLFCSKDFAPCLCGKTCWWCWL